MNKKDKNGPRIITGCIERPFTNDCVPTSTKRKALKVKKL